MTSALATSTPTVTGELLRRAAPPIRPEALLPGLHHRREVGLGMAGATGCRGAAPVAALAARPTAVTLWPSRATLLQTLPPVRLPRALLRACACSSWRIG
eukprot:6471294-Alexandrium_andersonii.AAC.1